MAGYTYFFTGRVLPERTWVTINDGKAIKMHLQSSDWGIDCEVNLCVDFAQISVVATSEIEVADLATMRNIVSDLVNLEIDAFGYLEGRGYQTEITAVTVPNGQQIVFPVEIKELQDAKHERPLGFVDLFNKVLLNQPGESPQDAFHRDSLRHALADLRQAIVSPADTYFHCYRAIESIMQGFKKPQGEGDEKGAWEHMRAALQVDKESLKNLAKASVVHRHGGYPPITGTQRVTSMRFTWRIVDRFIEFIRGGFKPLPVDQTFLLRTMDKQAEHQ